MVGDIFTEIVSLEARNEELAKRVRDLEEQLYQVKKLLAAAEEMAKHWEAVYNISLLPD